MSLSPDYKRDLKRYFSKRDDIAYVLSKGTEEQKTLALKQVGSDVGMTELFTEQNKKDIIQLALII